MTIATIKSRAFAALLAAVGLLTIAVLSLTGTTSAIGEGQIEGGDIYRVRNVTKNTAFSDPASAGKCETVQYKVRMHNPGPGEVSNVNVKVSLPAAASTQNVSTATITAQNAQPATKSDTATVNLSEALKVSYIGGSTQLLDTNSNVISSLPDGITGGGVNVGKVGVSLKEIKFVQFKAKTDCPQPPKPPEKPKKFKCESLNATMVTKNKYNFTAKAYVENVTVQSYKFTVFKNNAVVDQKTVTTGALTANYEFNQSAPGTYVVTAVVNTNAGSTNPNDCAKQIKVPEDDTPPPPPVTPPEVPPMPPETPGTPGAPSVPGSTVLPETGPAGTAAIVLLVAAASSSAYYVVARRFGQI